MAGYLAPKAVGAPRPHEYAAIGLLFSRKDVLGPHYVASNHLAEDLLHLIE